MMPIECLLHCLLVSSLKKCRVLLCNVLTKDIMLSVSLSLILSLFFGANDVYHVCYVFSRRRSSVLRQVHCPCNDFRSPRVPTFVLSLSLWSVSLVNRNCSLFVLVFSFDLKYHERLQMHYLQRKSKPASVSSSSG